eukprot:scaffold74709_cov38-Tisochrysis_lutea.AAC.3
MVLLHVFTHDCTCTQALEAADKLLFTREAIVGVAAKHGLEASFVPKMSSSAAGCGCHCHLSLWKLLNLLRKVYLQEGFLQRKGRPMRGKRIPKGLRFWRMKLGGSEVLTREAGLSSIGSFPLRLLLVMLLHQTVRTKQSEARYDDIAVGWVAMRELGVPSFVAWSSRQA